MDPYPTALALAPDGRLLITWQGDTQRSYTVKELRDACPCATCREKRNAVSDEPAPMFAILKPEEARPLKIDGMKPVGNYAYSIAFSDGHDTGIYTFHVLRELGREVT